MIKPALLLVVCTAFTSPTLATERSMRIADSGEVTLYCKWRGIDGPTEFILTLRDSNIDVRVRPGRPNQEDYNHLPLTRTPLLIRFAMPWVVKGEIISERWSLDRTDGMLSFDDYDWRNYRCLPRETVF